MDSKNKMGWRTVTEASPCSYCNKADWCAVTEDGSAAICRRINNGTAKVKHDVTGSEYFFYKLPRKSLQQVFELATPTERDQIYNAFLDALKLSDQHRLNLENRGLTVKDIAERKYRTFNTSGNEIIVAELKKKFGKTLLKVPGFYALDASKVFESLVGIYSRPGMLVSVRNNKGEIIGLKVRADTAEKNRRYSSMSSKSVGGPGSPASLHYPLTAEKTDVVYITEGELKADVVTAKTGNLCISIPGVSMWRQVAVAINENPPKRVIVAYDSDHRENKDVARNLAMLIATLMSSSTQLELAIWDDRFKGIDDALAAGADISHLYREQIRPYIENLLGALDLEPIDWNAPEKSALNTRSKGQLQLEVAESDDHWPEPVDLPDPLPKAPVLSPGLIPNALRPWIEDCSERMQVPADFFIIPALVAISSLIGRQLGIRPKQNDSWTVVCNLWGMIVGRPSALKSPAQSEALKFINLMAGELMDAYKDEEKSWRARETSLYAQKKALEERIKSKAKTNLADPRISADETSIEEIERMLHDERPRCPRLFTSDATTEKIGEILQDNKNGIMVLRDEIYAFLKSCDKPGREGDRAFYLEGWNGYSSHVLDRIGRGTILVDALCLSIIGGIQPGRLSEYIGEAMAGGGGDDGLMQRFQLAVFPETSKTYSYFDRHPNQDAKNNAELVFRKLLKLEPAVFQAQIDKMGDIPYLRFSPEASKIFENWLTQLELKLRNDSSLHPALESHLGKYRKLMPALALIFHVVEQLQNPVSSAGVSVESANLAIQWCDYLSDHAKRIYGLGQNFALALAKELLDRISQNRVKDGNTVRSIYRHHWKHLDTDIAVDSAIATLEEYGWVRRVEVRETGGAPSSILRLHPTLRSGGVR